MTLEIIGAGWGRTGTESLREALEIVGFGPCHHMHAIRDQPELLPDWQDFAAGRHRDWDRLFDGFRAQVDFPGAAYWRDLATHYPQAKVILTVRDVDEWYDSVARSVLALMDERSTLTDPHHLAVLELSEALIGNSLFEGRGADRAYMIERYNSHVKEVTTTLPADRVLVFRVTEGWGPLCGFLEVPVPDQPFPFRNDAGTYRGAWD